MTSARVPAEDARKSVLGRLRKIEGQIRGIHDMVEKGKSCEDVLIQVRAVKSALRSMTSLMVKTYLGACLQEAGGGDRTPEADRRLEETIAVLAKFIED